MFISRIDSVGTFNSDGSPVNIPSTVQPIAHNGFKHRREATSGSPRMFDREESERCIH